MAAQSNSSLERHLDDVMECPICVGTFTDPRVLPCIHSYCLKCIKELCKGKQSTDKVACPLCRKDFAIPEGRIDSLQKNFFLTRLLNIRELSKMKKETQLCDVCRSDESISTDKTAIMYCLGCQQKLCATCHIYHEKFTKSALHKSVRLEDKIEEDEICAVCPPAVCEKHLEEHVKIYCFDCKTVSCIMCYIELHNNHKCADVNKVSEDFRVEMTADIEKLSTLFDDYAEKIKSLENNKTEFVEKIKEAERKTCEQAEHLHDLIDRHKLALLNELDEIKKNRIKEIDNVHENVKQFKSMVESLKNYLKQIQSKGTASDVVREANGLKARLNDLMNDESKSVDECYASLRTVRISFCACDMKLNDADNIVGKVSILTTSKL
jgi:hypothetical protein